MCDLVCNSPFCKKKINNDGCPSTSGKCISKHELSTGSTIPTVKKVEISSFRSAGVGSPMMCGGYSVE